MSRHSHICARTTPGKSNRVSYLIFACGLPRGASISEKREVPPIPFEADSSLNLTLFENQCEPNFKSLIPFRNFQLDQLLVDLALSQTIAYIKHYPLLIFLFWGG